MGKFYKVRDNRYHAICVDCKKPVYANEGKAFLEHDGGKWQTAHNECFDLLIPTHDAPSNDAAPAPTEEPPPSLTDALATATQEAEQLMAHMQTALDQAVDRIGERTAEHFTAIVPGMVQELLASHRKLEITVDNSAPVVIDQAHKALPDVLLMVRAGVFPFLVGPAGSGKTTLAEQVAQAMDVPFYMAARVTSEYKLVGFIDANGCCVRTQFREAYECGGVFLFDEVDASDPDALTAFNAALANGLCDFPDGMVKRHKDFYAIAAGNTYGRGADRQYVGRNQLDAATLDRFCVLDVDYDEELERLLAPHATWTLWVQRVRSAIVEEKVRHIVSPRASIYGAKLLAAGMELSKVEECCVWKGLDTAQRDRVAARLNRPFANAA